MHRSKLVLATLATLAMASAAGQSRGQTLTTLGSFNGADGGSPTAGLTISADGSTFYGTTYSGGANGYGTVFSVPVTGGTPTVLASFNGTNGQAPEAGLILSGSTLYGTTTEGGANGSGEVFSIPVTGGAPPYWLRSTVGTAVSPPAV